MEENNSIIHTCRSLPNSPSQDEWEEYRQAGSEMQIRLVEWCECSHVSQMDFCFLFCFLIFVVEKLQHEG